MSQGSEEFGTTEEKDYHSGLWQKGQRLRKPQDPDNGIS